MFDPLFILSSSNKLVVRTSQTNLQASNNPHGVGCTAVSTDLASTVSVEKPI